MDKQEERNTMELLNSIERSASVSQRHLAKEMGVALGVVNACIKRCAKKGWIKIKHTPATRYAYFLTPTGFLEKTRLTKLYIRNSFALYRKVSAHFQDCFNAMAQQPEDAVVLVGLSDITEIALHWAQRFGVRVLGVLDLDGQNSAVFQGFKVYTSIGCVPEHALLVITAPGVSDVLLKRLLDRGPRQLVPLPL